MLMVSASLITSVYSRSYLEAANKKLTDLLAINPEDRRLRATLQRELDTLENAKGTLRRLFEGNGAQNQDSDGYGFMDLS